MKEQHALEVPPLCAGTTRSTEGWLPVPELHDLLRMFAQAAL